MMEEQMNFTSCHNMIGARNLRDNGRHYARFRSSDNMMGM